MVMIERHMLSSQSQHQDVGWHGRLYDENFVFPFRLRCLLFDNGDNQFADFDAKFFHF